MRIKIAFGLLIVLLLFTIALVICTVQQVNTKLYDFLFAGTCVTGICTGVYVLALMVYYLSKPTDMATAKYDRGKITTTIQTAQLGDSLYFISHISPYLLKRRNLAERLSQIPDTHPDYNIVLKEIAYLNRQISLSLRLFTTDDFLNT